jgi:peptidyl-Asp metalloendopeptidase
MKFRVGACALLVCLAGCTAEAPDTKFGDQRGAASTNAGTAQRLSSVQAGRQASQSVANAPDRGELISYKNKGIAIKREGAYTWYPVAISEAHALKAVVDGVMSIPSPDGSQVKVRYERHVEHPDGNWTWIGRVIGGDQQQEAILTFGEKAVYGSIPQAVGAPLSLQTRGGQLYAVQTDLSKVKNPNSRTDMMVPPALALRSALLASAPKAQVSQSAVETKAATPASTVDVAIGYTAGFAAAQGSQSAAVTRLVFLIDVGNQAFANSLITGALRLVNAVQVNYTDTTTNKAALGELTGNNGTAAVPIPASLVPLRTARDQYGADLAVLVRKFQTPENDGCGIAWLNGSDQTAINPATDDDFGFAVISDGNDTGTDGNSYFCAPETMVHELGHLMGSAHDRDNSKKDNGSLLYGRYPYSFGMKTTAANGNFYTIMAYGDNNQNFYRTFSNPLVLKCGPVGNLSCGVANQTDNARSLNQTIPVVATFRATVVPFVAARNDFNGDHRSDVLWRNSGSGVNTIWLSARSTTKQVVTTVANSAFKVVGTGDFNGDGAVDILWRNASTGVNTIWRSGNSSTTQAVSSVSGSWIVAGTGDFNGDGYDDILWRNSSTGANTIWRSGNSAVVQAVTAVPNAAFKVADTGDFDGDAKDDILWRNTTTGANTIWRSGNSSTIRAVASVPASWFVAGTGDFDADGSSDILWRNSISGANTIWRKGISTTVQATSAVASQAWQTEAVGDFNGDGRADILWRNSTSGANTIWLSGSSTTVQAMTGVSDLSWQIVP